MSKYLLDTNICVHLLKGQYDLENKIAQAGVSSCFLSEMTFAELLFGVENSAAEYREPNLGRVEGLQDLFAKCILLVGDCFYEYARQKSTLRRSGKL